MAKLLSRTAQEVWASLDAHPASGAHLVAIERAAETLQRRPMLETSRLLKVHMATRAPPCSDGRRMREFCESKGAASLRRMPAAHKGGRRATRALSCRASFDGQRALEMAMATLDQWDELRRRQRPLTGERTWCPAALALRSTPQKLQGWLTKRKEGRHAELAELRDRLGAVWAAGQGEPHQAIIVSSAVLRARHSAGLGTACVVAAVACAPPQVSWMATWT